MPTQGASFRYTKTVMFARCMHFVYHLDRDLKGIELDDRRSKPVRVRARPLSPTGELHIGGARCLSTTGRSRHGRHLHSSHQTTDPERSTEERLAVILRSMVSWASTGTGSWESAAISAKQRFDTATGGPQLKEKGAGVPCFYAGRIARKARRAEEQAAYSGYDRATSV